jgi:hypothetical protein
MRLNPLPLVLIGLALLAAPTFAADGEMAVVHRNATGLIFDSLVQHGGATLTVTGPDGYALRKTFAAGEDPIFSIFDQAGATLADGAYTFEVLFNPKLNGAAREALVKAREKGETPQIQSFEPVFGSFQIADGVLVGDATEEGAGLTSAAQPAASGSLEGTSAADQVINDDLIVTGSICAGFDCVNGETFGFDTLRLKENNLRIKFEDTSVGTFPTRDWQLTANDSASGGASKFSIDDIDGGRTPFTITAGAPSNSIFVDSGGRVGFGTNVPVVNLHVVSGNTPTLRLEQNGTSGFTPQVWDVAGNETNFFIRDATNGSRLPFRMQPNAPSNSIFVTGTSGNVGLGTSSPSQALHVRRSDSTATARALIENAGTTTNNSNEMLQLRNNGSIQVSMTDFQTGSDVTWQLNASANFFRIRVPGNATGDEFKLASNGDLEITGGLVTGTAGSCTVATPCDGVFEHTFDRPDLEQHAAAMWANKHLPAVGPTEAGQPVNLTQKTLGMLNELEMAHIYIEELNAKIAQLEKQRALEAQDSQRLEERLQRLEQLLAAAPSN